MFGLFPRVLGGWLTSTGQFNKGKVSEWKDRVTFEINEKDFK